MRRIILLFFVLLLSLSPALAAPVGSSQVLLCATEGEYAGACRDVTLGNYTADAMRSAAGTDLALFPTGLMGLNLQPGEVNDTMLADSFPNDEMVYVISLTAPELASLLELAAAPLCIDENENLDRESSTWDGFLQMSGLHVIYEVSALPGDKLYELKLDDASEPDLNDSTITFTVAVTESVIDGTYGFPIRTPEREVGMLRTLVARRITAEGITEEPDTDRIILYGAHENNIIDAFPPLLIVIVIILFVFFGGHKWRRSVDFER